MTSTEACRLNGYDDRWTELNGWAGVHGLLPYVPLFRQVTKPREFVNSNRFRLPPIEI